MSRTTWEDLYERHREVRKRAGEAVRRDVQDVFTRLFTAAPLAIDSHADPRSLFTENRRSPHGLREWIFSGPTGGVLPLCRTAELASAELKMRVVQRKNDFFLHAYEVSVRGTRPDGSPIFVAVDLHDDLQAGGDHGGKGACAHAALHCHVGPDHDSLPILRIPLPPLTPAEALECVLAQVIPEFEPAPWPD